MKHTDWQETITTKELSEIMAKRRMTLASYYKDGEKRRMIWYPGQRELVVFVNGVKSVFKDTNKGSAITAFRKGL